jgi:hypothetical protein
MPSLIQRSVRLKAIQLRKQGKTYSQIRDKLSISKGTLSYWSRRIKLSPNAMNQLKITQDLNLKRARLFSQVSLRVRQAKFLDDLRMKLKPMLRTLHPTTLKIALAFLYLGEGAKWKSHRGLQLGSSDPMILLLYRKLLKKCYSIDRDKLHCYICYRADQSLEELVKYWSRVLNISPKKFYKSNYDKRTIGKPTKNKNYKGVCVISCAGTEIQQELDLMTRILYEGL